MRNIFQPILLALIILGIPNAVVWAQEVGDGSSEAVVAAESNEPSSDAASDSSVKEEAVAAAASSDKADTAAEASSPVPAESAPEGGAAVAADTAAAVAASSDSAAEASVAAVDDDADDEDDFVAFAGTTFSYVNGLAPYSLSKKGWLSYNPYYAMDFGFKLSWWFNKHLNIFGSFTVSREITENDNTTFKNEALLSDTTIGLTYHNLYTIPVVGIDISLGGKLILPTSKASKADTAIVDLGLNLQLGRNFKIGKKGLQVISLGYTLAPKYNFHRYTTGESVTPRVNVSMTDRNYDALLSNGVRNAQFDLTNDISFNMAFTDWISFGASWGSIIVWLYNLKDGDLTVNGMSNQAMSLSYGVDNSTNRRYINYFTMYVSATPVEFLDINLIAETAYAQLALDGTYETPFFNDNTTIALELSFNFGGLSKFIHSKKAKK